MKNGMVEFDKDQIIELIDQAVSIYPEIIAEANDYLYDILHAVPLFVEEGIKYKWAHKSFAEYFAAVFICKERKEHEIKVLNNILKTENNKRFYNMLDFCYDIDYKAVVENLVYPILLNYISFYEKIQEQGNNIELWEEKVFHKFISNVYWVKVDEKMRPKDRNIIGDCYDAIEILKSNGIMHFSYASCLSKSENIIIVTQRKCSDTIIKLLYLKGMDIFKEVKVKNYPMKFLKNIDKRGVYNVFHNNQSESWILSNEDAIISTIFHDSTDYKGNILDIDKCRKKIKEIEVEKNKITDDFFSLS